MITIDDNMKKKLGQLIDSDGKIMISEDMPADLKAAISYLNQNNINLLSEISEEADTLEIDEESADLKNIDVNMNMNNETTDGSVGVPDYISEDASDVEVGDLEDLF